MRSVTARMLVFGFVLALSGLAHGAEPIKVGAVVSATGPAAYFGDAEAKTLKIEVARINREGGVLQRPLQLFLYDDASDPKQTVSFVRKLIEQDQVDVVLGPSTTGSTMAVVPIVQEAAMPLISMGGASVITEPVRKWVFKVPHSDRMSVERDYIDMQKHNISKIGLIGGSVGYDESCRKEARLIAPKYGISILGDETWAQTDTDMTPQLIKLRELKGLQAILNCGSQAPAAISARNYQRLGMSKTPLYFSQAVASRDFLDATGGAAEGVRLSSVPAIIAEQLPDSDPQKKICLAYEKEYEKVYHEPISTFGGHAYDALLLYVTAVRKIGSTDKAKVRDAIERSENVVGVDGIFNLSPTDHTGAALRALHMVEVRKGTWKLLE